jgi:hypothetical protein
MDGLFARWWPPPPELLDDVDPEEQPGRVPGLFDETN